MIQILDAIQRWRARPRWCAQCRDRPAGRYGVCSDECGERMAYELAWPLTR